MIDTRGFRANVGIILTNDEGSLFWARRIGQEAWQFPQGGIQDHETPEEALYRELAEEVGLAPEDVTVIGATRGWLRYWLPRRYVRRNCRPVCIGQKQKWFMLRLLGSEAKVCLDGTPKPEFDSWRWVSYWYPVRQVVPFKREVYRSALQELAPVLFAELQAAQQPQSRPGRP